MRQRGGGHHLHKGVVVGAQGSVALVEAMLLSWPRSCSLPNCSSCRVWRCSWVAHVFSRQHCQLLTEPQMRHWHVTAVSGGCTWQVVYLRQMYRGWGFNRIDQDRTVTWRWPTAGTGAGWTLLGCVLLLQAGRQGRCRMGCLMLDNAGGCKQAGFSCWWVHEISFICTGRQGWCWCCWSSSAAAHAFDQGKLCRLVKAGS